MNIHIHAILTEYPDSGINIQEIITVQNIHIQERINQFQLCTLHLSGLAKLFKRIGQYQSVNGRGVIIENLSRKSTWMNEGIADHPSSFHDPIRIQRMANGIHTRQL